MASPQRPVAIAIALSVHPTTRYFSPDLKLTLTFGRAHVARLILVAHVRGLNRPEKSSLPIVISTDVNH